MASGLLPVKQKGSGIMKCKHCKTKNITKAHYCKHCGSPFIQEDRDKAYNRTIFGILTNIRKLKSYEIDTRIHYRVFACLSSNF